MDDQTRNEAEATALNQAPMATPIEPAPSTHSSSKKPLLIIGGLLLLVLVIAGALFMRSQSSGPVRNQLGTVPTKTPTTSDESVVFMRGNEIWTQSASGSELQLTQTNSTVSDFETSPDGKHVAYVTGVKETLANNFVQINPDTVWVQPADGTSAVSVFTFKPITQPTQQYVHQIRDIGFSNNNQQLAITTSQSLWLYNLGDNTKKQVFDLPPAQARGMVYAYGNPIFSPSDDQILLSVGYYEGQSFGIVNIASGDLTLLPFTSYISGSKPLGWLDNISLLVSEYGGFDSIDTTSTLMRVEAGNPTQRTNLVTLPGSINDGVIAGEFIYLVQNITVNGRIINEAQTQYTNTYLLQYRVNESNAKTILSYEGETHPNIIKILPYHNSAVVDVSSPQQTQPPTYSRSIYLNDRKLTDGQLTAY